MDCSPPGASMHGILQAGILEWVAISYSRGPSLPSEPPGKPKQTELWPSGWPMCKKSKSSFANEQHLNVYPPLTCLMSAYRCALWLRGLVSMFIDVHCDFVVWFLRVSTPVSEGWQWTSSLLLLLRSSPQLVASLTFASCFPGSNQGSQWEFIFSSPPGCLCMILGGLFIFLSLDFSWLVNW